MNIITIFEFTFLPDVSYIGINDDETLEQVGCGESGQNMKLVLM